MFWVATTNFSCRHVYDDAWCWNNKTRLNMSCLCVFGMIFKSMVICLISLYYVDRLIVKRYTVADPHVSNPEQNDHMNSLFLGCWGRYAEPIFGQFSDRLHKHLKKLIGERPYLQIRQYDSAIVHFIRFTIFLYRTITRNSLRNHSPTVDLHVLHKMDSKRCPIQRKPVELSWYKVNIRLPPLPRPYYGRPSMKSSIDICYNPRPC